MFSGIVTVLAFCFTMFRCDWTAVPWVGVLCDSDGSELCGSRGQCLLPPHHPGHHPASHREGGGPTQRVQTGLL